MQSDYKIQAIALRRAGLTYTEIQESVPVSKATLSEWLRNVPVPDSYFEKIQLLRLKARKKGSEVRRNERIARTARIIEEAKEEASHFASDPFWVAGLTLYWAEGSKEKSWGRGVCVTFTNMDVDTLILFRDWCSHFLSVSESDFSYSLYVHDTRRSESAEFVARWATDLRINQDKISIYYKRSKITHVRKNDGAGYRGVFRLQVKRSVDSNRRISGWISGMILSLKGR